MAAPSPAVLEELRQKIAAIENRPALAEGAALTAARLACGEAVDAAPESSLGAAELLAVPPGILHEVYADDLRQSGAALGFTLGLARPLLGGKRQAILYLQLAADSQELGVPYSIGLSQHGIDPDRLVIGRIASVTELLWAIEEALACRAVAAVIADLAGHPRALDFTVSRRLSLRTAASGTSAFLIRYTTAREATAARLRWRILPAISGARPFDVLAPGAPRFLVMAEKRRLGRQQSAEAMRLVLDWSEHGFIEHRRQLGAAPRRPAPLYRPQPALLADRLPEAG